MKSRTLIATLFVAIAIGTVATRFVLDVPPAFADMKHDHKVASEDKMHAGHSDHGMDHGTGMYMHGDLVLKNVVARASVPVAKVGAGYLTITNNGNEPDTLVGGETEVANKLEVHEMKMDGDIMKMRELKDGITIEPGATVMLKPGGLHIMLMGLEAPLVKDTTFKAVLNFAKAGPIEIEFDVKDGKDLTHNH